MQKTGETTRDMWHKTDWDAVKKDPTTIGFPREDWIHNFDAEKHAEEVFDEIFAKHTSRVDGVELSTANSAPAPPVSIVA